MLCFTDRDKLSLSTAKSQHEKYCHLKSCVFRLWRCNKRQSSSSEKLHFVTMKWLSTNGLTQMTDSVQMVLEGQTWPSYSSWQKWLLLTELPHNTYHGINTEKFVVLNKDKIACPFSSWIISFEKLYILIINKCGTWIQLS